MAPVASRKDKALTDKQRYAGSDATSRLMPIPPHGGLAQRYPLPITSTLTQRNQAHQERIMYSGQTNPTGYTPTSVVGPYVASYNHDRQQLQNNVSLNKNGPTIPPQFDNRSVSPYFQQTYFNNGGYHLPNHGNVAMDRMCHENSSPAVDAGTGDPHVLERNNYANSQLPLIYNPSHLYATSHLNHSNLHDKGFARSRNIQSVETFVNPQTASSTKTDHAQKPSNFDPWLGKLSPWLVEDYLKYLILNCYNFHVSEAFRFLTVKYPALANPFYSFKLNEQGKELMSTPYNVPLDIIQDTTARASVKPPPPLCQDIVPTQVHGILQRLNHSHHLAGAQKQNMVANTASFSTQQPPKLLSATQTPQNSRFPNSNRSSQSAITEAVPTPAEINRILGTHNTNRRSPYHGVMKKSVKQTYSNTTKQIPSDARNFTNVITTSTADNQPHEHIDHKDESQKILENKITAMHITANQPTKSNEPRPQGLPIPETEMIYFQNTSTRKINDDQTTVYENEGLVISYQNCHSGEIQEAKASETLRNILTASNENAIEFKSFSNKSEVETNTDIDVTYNRPIIPSTNERGSEPAPSVNKLQDRDNIKASPVENALPAAHKTAPENNSSTNKPQKNVDTGIHGTLPSFHNSALKNESNVESNIDVQILPSNNRHSSERKSPSRPQVAVDKDSSNDNISENDIHTEEIDFQSPLLVENQNLEQEPVTEEGFLEEFTSFLHQLDSHNNITNDLFERLGGIILKSTESADSLKKVFSNNLETSDDTVSSTTSSEPP